MNESMYENTDIENAYKKLCEECDSLSNKLCELRNKVYDCCDDKFLVHTLISQILMVSMDLTNILARVEELGNYLDDNYEVEVLSHTL